MNNVVIVHYGEIGLKGRNRRFFERRLCENIRNSLKMITQEVKIKGIDGRIILTLKEDDINFLNEVIGRLREIPGIVNFGIGYYSEKKIEKIGESAVALASSFSEGSFKVETKRSDKRFPYTSPEINRQIGQLIIDNYNYPVNLTAPDNIIHIEITRKEVFIFTKKYSGLGGLPVGVSGNVLSLISAGFDSPVASFMMMKRGAYVYFIHYHSYPYVSKSSIDQVKKLLSRLSNFQHMAVCYFYPLADIQKQIMITAPPRYRVLLYRRMMVRISQHFARKHKCEALVTGESLGQVSSQTLRNMGIINEISSIPILRPLVGMDKEEIMTIARKLGTYEISAQPYDDCCSFLIPRQAETWGSIDEIKNIEESLQVQKEIERAIENTEKIEIKRSYQLREMAE